MRIPLDYYRILGVPIQATERQISQAYQDRRLQMPRREYSDIAITARQKLLDRAYAELSHPEKRSQYNNQFLKNYELQIQNQDKSTVNDSQQEELQEELAKLSPWLEISQDQFLGALIILQELGEYELVLRLGDSYLVEENKEPETPEKQTERKDIILTIALGCLELGREQWQQKEYENAVASGKSGQELLLREGLFPTIQGEIQADLSKLRPYRILELLAVSEDNLTERRKGLRLLQEMLQERGGIEGLGDDKSGLNIDDFLRFIQQLRDYLTAEEQQELFEFEAKRPSAVATYLAVYALLARGFAQKKPELIVRAKKLLLFLRKRQDVHLEQAICALLLGQTEEANHALELSHEDESIAFIRENSQGDPDLLHGLCLYTERWLENEVFLHFRDLIDREVSLTEYFANSEVQAYLEKLPSEQAIEANLGISNKSLINYQPKVPKNNLSTTSSDNTIIQDINPSERDSQKTSTKFRPIKKFFSGLVSQLNSLSSKKSQRKVINPNTFSPITSKKRRRKLSRNKNKLNKKIPLILVSVIGIIGVFSLSHLLFNNKINSEELGISLNKSPIPIPSDNDETINSSTKNLDENISKEIIQTWLNSKVQAFGKNHQIDILDTILTDPLLSVQRNRAKSMQNKKSYLEYEHEITIKNIKINPQNSDQAKVEAEVTENAKYYHNEQLIEKNSYNSDLLVSYDLVYLNETWLISNLKVIR